VQPEIRIDRLRREQVITVIRGDLPEVPSRTEDQGRRAMSLFVIVEHHDLARPGASPSVLKQALSVTSAGRLSHRIEPRGSAVDDRKVDVHTGLDHLCRDHPTRCVGLRVEPPMNLLQDLTAVGPAHAGAQMQGIGLVEQRD